jgi:hypothetical protein
MVLVGFPEPLTSTSPSGRGSHVTVAIRSPSNGKRDTNHELGGQLTKGRYDQGGDNVSAPFGSGLSKAGLGARSRHGYSYSLSGRQLNGLSQVVEAHGRLGNCGP